MPEALVKIFGERNSGTKLLRQIISRNSSSLLWPGTTKEIRESHQTEAAARYGDVDLDGRDSVMFQEYLADEMFDRCFDISLGWKHAAPSPNRIIENARYRDTSFIVISKNPYAWLLSLYRSPHHNLLAGNMKSFSTFLRKPWLTTRRDNAPGIFASPIELWNYKYRAYIEFSNIAKITFIRYEDVLENPAVVFSTGGILLSSDEPLDIPQHSLNGGAIDFDTYRKMYSESFWFERINRVDTEAIGQSLDHRVLDHLGYGAT